VGVYDPELDSWDWAAELPESLNHANAGVIGEKIYVGGYYPGGGMREVSDRTFEYDPVADAWTEKAPMPSGSARAAACIAVLDGELFVLGGARDGSTVADVSAYDVAADSWRELPDLPEPREHCAAGAVAGKIYIAGGRANGIPNFEPNTWELDPATGTYTAKAAIPTPRGGVAAAVLRGRLFVFGGEGSDVTGGVFGDVEAFDPATNSWQAYPPMGVPRHGMGAATLGDRIYLPAGAIRMGGAADASASVFFFVE
jgi:N-acetylneuraminic acid mutarotase